MVKSTLKTRHFHQKYLAMAKRYIRLNYNKNLTLKNIAKNAGVSEFHFARMFMAYTMESPFQYIKKVRMREAILMMEDNPDISMTDIAFNVGYETSSSFNKVFKEIIKMSPRDFRNLGKEEKFKFIYDLGMSPIEKERPMNLNLKHEIAKRNDLNLIYVEKNGIFKEVAMPTWYELIPLVDKHLSKEIITEYLGFSVIENNSDDDSKMIYLAGVGVTSTPDKLPKGLSYKKIKGGKYAKYVLIGATHQVWDAFDIIFKDLAEKKIQLRDGACIENYLSNPEIVPEAELVTELLVPIL